MEVNVRTFAWLSEAHSGRLSLGEVSAEWTVELLNPFLDNADSLVDDNLDLWAGIVLAGEKIRAVVAALDDERRSVGRALERSAWTEVAGNARCGPWIVLAVYVDDVLGLEWEPSSGILVESRLIASQVQTVSVFTFSREEEIALASPVFWGEGAGNDRVHTLWSAAGKLVHSSIPHERARDICMRSSSLPKAKAERLIAEHPFPLAVSSVVDELGILVDEIVGAVGIEALKTSSRVAIEAAEVWEEHGSNPLGIAIERTN